MAEPVDDWAPVGQASPQDDWRPVGATQQPAVPDIESVPGSEGVLPGPMPAVPKAFVDRVVKGAAISSIIGKAVEGWNEGLGAEPVTGVSDETRQQMVDIGLIHDPAKGGPGPVHLFNEAMIFPTAKAFETLMRGVNAGVHGAAGAVGQIVDEVNGYGETGDLGGEGSKAKREVINAGNWALIEAGFGRFARPSPAADHVIGTLPRDVDFKSAATVVAGDAEKAAVTEPRLKELWQERGLHPSEVAHDAQSDAFLRHDLTAPYDKSLSSLPERLYAGPLNLKLTPISGKSLWHETSGENAADILREDLTSYVSRARTANMFVADNPDIAIGQGGSGVRIEFDGNQVSAVENAKPGTSDLTGREYKTNALGNNSIKSVTVAAGEHLDLGRAWGARFEAEFVPEKLPDGSTRWTRRTDEDVSGPEPALRSLGAEVTSLPPDVPPEGQPLQQPGSMAATIQAGADKLLDIGKDMQMLVAPMATGTPESIAIAKDFANSMRRNRWEWSRTDADIAKRFTPEQRTRMWNAADEESVLRQEAAQRPPIVQFRAQADTINSALPPVEDGLVRLWRGNRQGEVGTASAFTNDLPGIALPFRKAYGGDLSYVDVPKGDLAKFENKAGTPRNSEFNVPPEVAAKAKAVSGETYAAASDHMGLSTLEPVERAAVEELQGRAQVAWARARDLGMVEGEGLPAYTPRMVINASSALSGDTAIPLNGLGLNLRTRTSQMMHRAYMTAEETEAAMKKGLGADAEIARDIRALPLATAKLEDAIAGRSLIENIKDYGKRTGSETVAEGAIPAGSDTKWFTLDHPAFRTWRPKLSEGGVVKDAEGNIIFEQVPLYVHGDFEGPLRAVLTQRSGPLYQGMMALKGKSMSLIMNSPMIHNAVEFGRAFPAMPTRIIKAYFDGNRAKNDVALMTEAIDNGLVPIGKRFFNQDITSVMESPDITPGRSWTAKVLAAVPGLFDEAAGVAVKRAIDKAGDFWHNTLLWDRIADLQMGIYTNMRGDMLAKGVDQQTASRVAAHFANRYAGALPKEAMSDAATKVANMMLFSRTFTMGNLGVMKDMLTGLPKDVLAQIERDTGTVNPEAAGYAKAMARRKAFSTVMLDIGLLYVGNSVMQSALNVMLGDSTLSQEGHGYARRLKEVTNEVSTHPLALLQPFDLAEKLSATADNEPGKKDRLKIGYAKDGTAIYARNPVGKIGEEFVGYLTGPLDMLRKKQGTIARPMLQVINNDKGFGRKIYDPTAETPAKYANNLWEIVKHFGKAQIPEGQLSALSDLVKGDGDPKVNMLQATGPFAGVTFAKGAPGGPAVGEMYHAREQQQFRVNAELPDIRKQIVRGDVAGATARMSELGIAPGLQRFYVKTSQNPATRLSPRALQDFYRTATPQQRQRMENLRSPGPLSPDQ